jgi:indole-3-glycerol phosphate synthase
LAKYIPDDFVKISESGISKASQIIELKQHGFEGFLIGGYFMKHDQPGQACKNLIDDFQTLAV